MLKEPCSISIICWLYCLFFSFSLLEKLGQVSGSGGFFQMGFIPLHQRMPFVSFARTTSTDVQSQASSEDFALLLSGPTSPVRV